MTQDRTPDRTPDRTTERTPPRTPERPEPGRARDADVIRIVRADGEPQGWQILDLAKLVKEARDERDKALLDWQEHADYLIRQKSRAEAAYRKAEAQVRVLRSAAVELLAAAKSAYKSGSTGGYLYTGVGDWVVPGRSGLEDADRLTDALAALEALTEVKP